MQDQAILIMVMVMMASNGTILLQLTDNKSGNKVYHYSDYGWGEWISSIRWLYIMKLRLGWLGD